MVKCGVTDKDSQIMGNYAICNQCGEYFSSKRRELGYKTCLECGQEDAVVKMNEIFKKVMPLGNKTNYGLITGNSIQEMKSNILGHTGKGITKHNV